MFQAKGDEDFESGAQILSSFQQQQEEEDGLLAGKAQGGAAESELSEVDKNDITRHMTKTKARCVFTAALIFQVLGNKLMFPM